MEAITYILLCAVLIIVMYNGLYSVTGGFSTLVVPSRTLEDYFVLQGAVLTSWLLLALAVFTYEVFNPLMIIALVLTGYDLYAKRDSSWGVLSCLAVPVGLAGFVMACLS